MEPPVNCPFCNNSLMNFFVPSVSKTDSLQKHCYRSLNHKFTCWTKHHNFDTLSAISITYEKRHLFWDFNYKTLRCDEQFIPWIEPDLKNIIQITKRINKLLPFI